VNERKKKKSTRKGEVILESPAPHSGGEEELRMELKKKTQEEKPEKIPEGRCTRRTKVLFLKVLTRKFGVASIRKGLRK